MTINTERLHIFLCFKAYRNLWNNGKSNIFLEFMLHYQRCHLFYEQSSSFLLVLALRSDFYLLYIFHHACLISSIHSEIMYIVLILVRHLGDSCHMEKLNCLFNFVTCKRLKLELILKMQNNPRKKIVLMDLG